MGPKKTWQPLDYHTTRHDIDQQTNGHSTPFLRHTSNPTSSHQQASLTPDRRAFSSVLNSRVNSEQPVDPQNFHAQYRNQDPIGRRLSLEVQTVSPPPSLPSPSSDSASLPILDQRINSTANVGTSSNRLRLGGVPRARVTLPPTPRTVSTEDPGRPAQLFGSQGVEQPPQGLQHDGLSRYHKNDSSENHLPHGQNSSPISPLDFSRSIAINPSSRPSRVEYLSFEFWPRLPLVKLPSVDNLSASLNTVDDHYDPTQGSDEGEGDQGGNVMAGLPYRTSPGEARRSSRLENRPPMSTVLCRNGPQCRKFVEGTCHYNHDFGSMAPNGLSNNAKKSLTVDSPAFTPKSSNVQPVKNLGISPKAAAAATFTPRGSGTVTPSAFTHTKELSGEFVPAQMNQPAPQFQEFVPGQSFVGSPQLEAQTQIQQQINPYSDPFLAGQNLGGLDGAHVNPYAQQGPTIGGQGFYPDASNFKHPLNYHLYSTIGPRRENLATYQRVTADFFVPDDLREELQRKSEATLQTFANSTLPHTVEHFHSLVALDTNNTKGVATFGYPSWIYKAISSKDGHVYALRRVEGFRLSSETSIRTINSWKRINSASMVQVHDAFTGRWFGDSSLIIVTDYHPRSQTLAEKHFSVGRNTNRSGAQITPENELWGYIVQLASALKTIHEAGIAAQTVMASKVLLTSKNRVRLNGCGVFDIIQHDQSRPLVELQRADLQDLGRLIVGIATRNQTAHQNLSKALDLVARSYTERLRSCIAWLLVPPPLPQDGSQALGTSHPSTDYNVNSLLTSIVDKAMVIMDSTLHLEDELTTNLGRELENGRLARLLAKLNVILERPDISINPAASSNPALLNQPSMAWSETGERYYLKLFRDFVFHQVDHDGRPVLDLGHIITCLNKLDAGIDEKIQLMSRDEANVFVVSYKEVKRGFEAAWAEISKASNPARR